MFIVLFFVGLAMGIGLGYSIGYSRGEKKIPSRLLKYVQDKQDTMLDEAIQEMEKNFKKKGL